MRDAKIELLALRTRLADVISNSVVIAYLYYMYVCMLEALFVHFVGDMMSSLLIMTPSEYAMLWEPRKMRICSQVLNSHTSVQK